MNINVLIFRTDTGWVAQCLQYDIAAQGKTIEEAQEAFVTTVIGEVAYAKEKGVSMDTIPKAPECFWEQYKKVVAVAPLPQQSLEVPADIKTILSQLINTPDKLAYNVELPVQA